jgi:hypothetical protein
MRVSLKAAGFVLGLAGVALAVFGWRIPGGDGTLGADVIFVSHLSGELEVSPTGPFITKAGLEPADEATGTLKIRNRTGSRLAIRPEVVADTHDLDRFLRLEIKAGEKVLFSGRLGRLRDNEARAFVLVRGQGVPLTFRAWLPISIRSGYQGRIAQVDVQLRARRLAA